MTFEWSEYLDLAIRLNNEAKGNISLKEALYRTSISRAYYSCFNLAKNYLISAGKVLSRTADAHKEIQLILEDMSIFEINSVKRKDLIEISNELAVLRSFRNKADYNNSINKISMIAESTIIRAIKIKKLIERLW
ncbi:MAG: HEPN domain-containing protein [Thermoplasmatales archaeon]|nr:HEPN domain-containing protein [Thermoplasmatales archaeon]MCW6170331.1 HEPN domain-containing protein [Thermoplasmatales archaeon]